MAPVSHSYGEAADHSTVCTDAVSYTEQISIHSFLVLRAICVGDKTFGKEPTRLY